MPVEAELGVAETLARLDRDVSNLKEALAQLGVKPCSACGKFYLASTPGNLFTDAGNSVCYACLPAWWLDRAHNLPTSDREAIEYRLTSWLVAYHGGRIFREWKELPHADRQCVHLVAACHECKGTGKMGGGRCRYCLGNGTVWVITTR